MLDLDGKRILVVGASAGIGRTVARMAAAEGARVAVSARRADKLADLDAFAIPGDVRDEADCHRIVDDAVAEFGGLDGLVYSVGMSMLKPLADATMDDWRTVFEANVFGASLVISRAAPHLVACGGRAVVLSSKAARDPFPDLSLYTTSKIALDGLLRCLPREFPGLLTSRVVVGNTVDTEFASSWDAAALEAASNRWVESGVLGTGGLMHPEQVAAGVLFALAGPAFIDDIAIIDSVADDGSPPSR